MYIDIRAIIFVCKDNINTKTLKILVILLMLFFSVFRPSGLFMLSWNHLPQEDGGGENFIGPWGDLGLAKWEI